MNQEQLTLAIDLFETKIEKLEYDYKKKHKEDFDSDKMKKFVNKNLKREMALLTAFNIKSSIEILKNTERFKY